MRAIVVQKFGGPENFDNQGDLEVLRYGLDLPAPQPGTGLRAKLWSSRGNVIVWAASSGLAVKAGA